jgi:hypothetical protein
LVDKLWRHAGAFPQNLEPPIGADEELSTHWWDYIIQLMQIGQSGWNLLEKHLGFPAWSTAREKRRRILAERGIAEENFNGSAEGVAEITHAAADLKKRKFEDPKKVKLTVGLDAISVKSHISFEERDGTVFVMGMLGNDGLPDTKQITPEKLQRFRDHPEELEEWLKKQLKKGGIIADAHIITINWQDARLPTLPVAFIRRADGKANPKIMSILHEVIDQLETKLGVDAIATDGDTGSLGLLDVTYEVITMENSLDLDSCMASQPAVRDEIRRRGETHLVFNDTSSSQMRTIHDVRNRWPGALCLSRAARPGWSLTERDSWGVFTRRMKQSRFHFGGSRRNCGAHLTSAGPSTGRALAVWHTWEEGHVMTPGIETVGTHRRKLNNAGCRSTLRN